MAGNVVNLSEYAPLSELSQQAQRLIDYASKRPTKASRADIVAQFNETFQLIGGVPRLALWADANPSQFFALYSKLLPAAIKADVSLQLPDIDGLTPEQVKELSVDQIKHLLLVKLGQDADVIDSSDA